MKINEWAKEDRPREKMERLGAEALSNAELLAILIGSGTPNESAVELMQKVLSQSNNNLNTLGKKSIKELMAFKGVGPAKAITILAACELGKRRQQELAEERLRLDSSQGIYQLMRPTLQDLDAEEAWLLLLNQQCKLIRRCDCRMEVSHRRWWMCASLCAKHCSPTPPSSSSVTTIPAEACTQAGKTIISQSV